MQSINALSKTRTVLDWLRKSRQPQILHIFDQACNLINEDREVISIVSPEIGNGPFNLVVNGAGFKEYIDRQTEVSASPGRLTLGDLTVEITTAETWSARPGWEDLHSRRENIAHFTVELPNTLTKPALPDSVLDRFSTALARANVSSALMAVSRLAGLGAGLTPAGDDFIMGGLYAAWVSHPHETAGKLSAEIAEAAAPLTTSLSAAWLRSAGRGEAGVVWHEFLNALMKDPVPTPDHLQEKVEKILEVGETSGADALAGFVRTLSAFTKIPS